MCFLILLTDLQTRKGVPSEKVAGLGAKLQGHMPATRLPGCSRQPVLPPAVQGLGARHALRAATVVPGGPETRIQGNLSPQAEQLF